MQLKTQLYNDNFQNFKRYNIPKAQLVIADIPYNLGKNAYASSNQWYVGGDNRNGESEKANTQFFHTDGNFNLVEYMHFCSKLLRREPKEKNQAPAMIVFCSFEQIPLIKEYAYRYGFKQSFPLHFIKQTSSQVLKSNMRIVGATEHALVLYRNKLPKFRNEGQMIKNWFYWQKDSIVKVHPTQKPLPIIRRLIEIFTDKGDVVIDPVAGSGVTLRAASEIDRHSYGFEIYKPFYKLAQEKMLKNIQKTLV